MTRSISRARLLVVALILALTVAVAAPAIAHSAGHSMCESGHVLVSDPHAPGWGHRATRSGAWTIKYHYYNSITGWVHQHNSSNYCG